MQLCPFSWKTGTHFWRTKRDGSLVSLSPAKIKNFWMGLPPDTDRIDAVYERRSDNRIIFFIGRLSRRNKATWNNQLQKTFWKLNLFRLALFIKYECSISIPFCLRPHFDRSIGITVDPTAGGDKSTRLQWRAFAFLCCQEGQLTGNGGILIPCHFQLQYYRKW